MLRRESKAAALAVAVCGFLAAAYPERAVAGAPESQEPIKIALFDWTSVNVNANILGDIYKKLGYKQKSPTSSFFEKKPGTFSAIKSANVLGVA